jgi:hypothetical protein
MNGPREQVGVKPPCTANPNPPAFAPHRTIFGGYRQFCGHNRRMETVRAAQLMTQAV